MEASIETFVFGAVPDSVEGVGDGYEAGEDAECSNIKYICSLANLFKRKA